MIGSGTHCNRLPSLRLCYLLVACLALAAWGRTAGFGFVWDDHYFILQNPGIRTIKNVPAMFDSRIAEAWRPSDFPNFRPLRNVAYALLCQLGGKTGPQPWIFHLANSRDKARAAWKTALRLEPANRLTREHLDTLEKTTPAEK